MFVGTVTVLILVFEGCGGDAEAPDDGDDTGIVTPRPDDADSDREGAGAAGGGECGDGPAGSPGSGSDGSDSGLALESNFDGFDHFTEKGSSRASSRATGGDLPPDGVRLEDVLGPLEGSAALPRVVDSADVDVDVPPTAPEGDATPKSTARSSSAHSSDYKSIDVLSDEAKDTRGQVCSEARAPQANACWHAMPSRSNPLSHRIIIIPLPGDLARANQGGPFVLSHSCGDSARNSA